MKTEQRIEAALGTAIARAQGQGCPPQLAAALRDAVFPGGARIRPKLCLAVARACGDDQPALSDAAAAAVELLHCASLVHDDMPCFDDAPLRRGKPSIHRAYGERIAVLAGDALIVLGFETLARAGGCGTARLAGVMATLAAGVGAPHGIVAGQAWECESQLDLGDYHRAKTGALFAAAAAAGAQAAGASPQGWTTFGLRLGEAYQVADDIRDAAADPDLMGKPAGRDAALGRPNMAASHGLSGALLRFESLMGHVLDVVPACHGSAALRHMVRMESERLVPKAWHGELSRQAA